MAPGEPRYVIGNLVRLPQGTSRTYVTVFSRLATSNVRVDGVPQDVLVESEAGYVTTSLVIDIPAGDNAEPVRRSGRGRGCGDRTIDIVHDAPTRRDVRSVKW